ncbi:uncharacterized protein LOC119300516 [Triticum dicoccoides]|uniref:uncharacterized protein LOC119300516 n=1 Tax=Triticum dicoccoides TaxID=85692 RepID=UPI00188FFB4E|nr:uncharacterized protein LOC119300516 [Triticum dicoccoides]XP_037433362.1 uncharacterized protein LOC119300516 [Triticum dicoccoides]
MTIVDFIELSDDNIIDLSSDEETVQKDQIATQDRVTLLDRQGMFLLAGEGSQDVPAVFVVASEGSQEAAECGHAFEATASSMVTEKAPFVAANEGRQDAAESGNALEATPLSFVTKKAPLDTAKSPNCHRSPTSASFPGPTSTTPKALTSEGGDAKSVRVKRKYRKKNYHTGTARKSHRLIQIGTSRVEELAADQKRSRTIEPAEESAASTDKAGPAKLSLPTPQTSCS